MLSKLFSSLAQLIATFKRFSLVSDCMNEQHKFYYYLENFYEERIHGSQRWNLPLHNPFHALTLILFCAGMVVTPTGYAAIYRYQRWKNEIHFLNISFQF